MDTKIGISFEPLGVGGLNFRVFLSLYVPVSGASMEGIENFWWSIFIFLDDLKWNDPGLILDTRQINSLESFLDFYGTLQIKSFFRMFLPIGKNIDEVGYIRL